MTSRPKKNTPAKRLAQYRKRAFKSGMRRVEVAVPSRDVETIRNFARAFREGGAAAERLREQSILAKSPVIAKTGKELVRILRAAAKGGFELELPPREVEEPREIEF